MLSDYRVRFNTSWTPDRYRHFLEALDRSVGRRIEIPLSETPCFFPSVLLEQMARAGEELVQQLLEDGGYLSAATATIPERYRMPHTAARPMFVCADFGVVRTPAGDLEPRLVEIQGFPSLYGFQPRLGRQYLESYGLPSNLTYLLSGLTEATYYDLLRRAIVGDHDPENVILLEVDPERQKTLPDFIATQQTLGIPYVCITTLKRRGNRLYYEKSGTPVPIHRIYNRAIVDELERRNVQVPFDWRDDLDVEWAGHPDWFFKLSKFSIPYFRHAAVPKTAFLSDVARLPEDPHNYVLKPLYSFAGLGVIVGPTQAQLEAIPAAERPNYILQERVHFEPIIDTPHGMTKAEVRIMYVWPDDGPMTPVTTIVRMGRGKMMGVDHNKGMQWVGGSAALIPTS